MMGRRETHLENLWEKAVSKGYKPGAHWSEDSKRDSTTYVPKTLKDQNGALKSYQKWVDIMETRRYATGKALSDH
ncbi:MAG: hypothetical protein Q9214_004411 [Letrouitia sp. 1 TL-2023]